MAKQHLIFYFHGYGSSPNSDKVARLKEHFPFVYAFPIDIDPDVSLPYLKKEIEKTRLKHVASESVDLVFVGTSLGGWYASELAHPFDCDAVIINPAYAPQHTLPELGVPSEVRAKYHDMVYPPKTKYFIGRQDEVIDFEPITGKLKRLNTLWVEGAGHRFNGKEFDLVIDYIKSLP